MGVPQEAPDSISYRRLLAEFTRPNTADAVARSPHWKDAFRDPVLADRNPVARKDPAGNSMGPDLAALFTRSDFDARQSSLQDRLQKDLSDNEVIWEMLKGHAHRTAREGNLARCRNVHVAMANHLLRRDKRGRELQALCIVCVFDLCGVRNRDDAPAEIRKSHSRFDAARASLAPWLVSRVRNLSRELALSMGGIREIFLQVCTRLPVPRDPRKLWAVLQLALEGGFDSADDVRRSRAIRQILE
jgi:hypothetical protein